MNQAMVQNQIRLGLLSIIKIKPHDISEELNLVKNNNIWFRKFIYSKDNFKFELIHIPKFHSVLVEIYSFIVWYMVRH